MFTSASVKIAFLSDLFESLAVVAEDEFEDIFQNKKNEIYLNFLYNRSYYIS